MKSNSFTKELRLLKPKDFQYLKRGADRISTPFLRFYVKKSRLGQPYSRLGLSVSRKSGNAVQRNLIKRKLRENFRLGTLPELGLDILVVASPRLKELQGDFEQVKASVDMSWRKATAKEIFKE